MGSPTFGGSRQADAADGGHLTSFAGIDAGEGPSVLLLHGQPGSAASWSPVVPLLTDRFRVLVPDRPGYGATVGSAQGVEENAAVLAAMLEERANGPTTVAAHSWAGGAAVLLATQRPDLVAALVLIGAACTSDSLDGTDRVLALPVLGHAAAALGLVVLGEVLPRVRRMAGFVPASRRERFLAALPDQGVLGGQWGTFARQRRSFVIEQRALVAEMPQVAESLPGLQVPVAVVMGEWDLVVSPASSVTLAAAVPGSELISLPEAGHFAIRDEPVTIAEVIARYADQPASLG